MPISNKPSDELLKPEEDMVFGLELKKISSRRHSSSKTANKKSSVSPQSSPSPKDADKLKPKSALGLQLSDRKHKGKKDAEGKVPNRDSFRRSAAESDELVKHMSNLPGYLLRTDKGDKSQEKTFNVGVLNWSRLEKWNNNRNHFPVLASNFTSFNSGESSSSSGLARKLSAGVAGKEKLDGRKGTASSNARRSSEERLRVGEKLPFQNVKRFESSKGETKSMGDEQRTTQREFKSFSKIPSDTSLEKVRRNEHRKRTSKDGNFNPKSRLHVVSHVPGHEASGKDEGAKQKDYLQEHNRKKKERNHKSRYDMGQPSVKSKHKEVSASSSKTSSGSSEAQEKVNQLQKSNFDIDHQHSCRVLPYPQEIPQPTSSDDVRHSELRTSPDYKNSESSQSSLSYFSLPEELCAEDVCSEIPHSTALSAAAEFPSSSQKMRHSIGANPDNDCSSVVSETPPSASKISSRRSLGSWSGKGMLDTSMRNQFVSSNIKESLDKEAVVLTAQRGMNASHSRRFSFSLSQIGRSFSFREPPTIPQLSSSYVSAKSGPVTPETSVRWDNSGKEKANSHSRAKSSPLRRLLDPLLKHKALSLHHSAESNETQKAHINSHNSTAVGLNESLSAKKSEGSSIQGLLQLTVKNGVPLFKFVLNNERKIFAATRKSLSSQEKEDLDCYFTFYLVNEIKKKSSGWMSHGSKEKSCGYTYNCIAQMKFSGSKITEPINQNLKRQQMIKEFILLGVEIGQTEQGRPKFIQGRELAAIVIDTPGEYLSKKGMQSDDSFLKNRCLKCFAEDRCLCGSGDCSRTTVILPGGIHGSPDKGEPSPLIYRWKTGGSCDCGGWDIGCKLLVLSNKEQSSNVPKDSKPSHDSFKLFVQEGAEQNVPLFTLSPMNDGFYSVEFNSTITYLQAFFISVGVLSCQKLTSSLEMGDMLEEILKDEPGSKNSSNRFHGQAPLKYTPIPPLSPVGRV